MTNLCHGRDRSSHVPGATGARVRPTTDDAHANIVLVLPAIHAAHDQLACCVAHAAQWPRAIHVRRELCVVDTAPASLPVRAAEER